MVAVEAQATGCPCILSDAVPRDADPAGTAIVFPTNDENACTRAIISIEPERRLDVARPSFLFFDIKSAAPRLVEWYEALVASISVQKALL